MICQENYHEKKNILTLKNLENRWNGPTINYWTDDQCTFLANLPFDLLACQEECLATTGCNALNYGNNEIGNSCTLIACSSPIPEPSGVDPRFNGYYLSPGMLCNVTLFIL